MSNTTIRAGIPSDVTFSIILVDGCEIYVRNSVNEILELLESGWKYVTPQEFVEANKREWTCENCGTKHHRDLNAAINLKNYAVGFTVSACGEFSASGMVTRGDPVKQPRNSRKRKKQESYTNQRKD